MAFALPYRYGLAILLFLLPLFDTSCALPLHGHASTFRLWLTHQSQHISLAEWLKMFTLCLAPLVTHIAFGLPREVVLGCKPPPSWSDQIGLYNPTTIVWRYYVIAARRFLARHWDEADMAACNAIFWDSAKQRWDGSEDIMAQSRDWISYLPKFSHVEILSGSSLASLAITLQGVQAILFITSVFGGQVNTVTTRHGDGLPSVFSVIAIVGLIRLQAAPWLSSDYGYAKVTHWGVEEESNNEVVEGECTKVEAVRTRLPATVSRLKPRDSVRRVFFRIWWAVSILAFMGTAIMAIIGGVFFLFSQERPEVIWTTASRLSFNLLYFTLSLGTMVIFWLYLAKDECWNTVIPCIQSRWYKGYTFLLFGVAVVCVIFTSVETRVTINGDYSTFPPIDCDSHGVCHRYSEQIVRTYVLGSI